MYGALHVTPVPRGQKPAWAIALKRRREKEVGSQEEMAARADLSQSLISQIEWGVQHPTGLSVERFGRLLDVLNWTPAEFSEATGITLPFVEGAQSPRRGYEIPDTLAQAIQQRGHERQYAALRDPAWQQYLAGFRFRQGSPQTPDEWIDLYRDLVRAGVTPGGH